MDRVKIDRFGRVLIPKKVRERLRLEADDEIRLEIHGDKLVLEQLGTHPKVVREGSLLVFDGVLNETGVDWVAESRDARTRQILESDSGVG